MRERPIASVSELQRGQIIRNLGSSDSYVVVSTNGASATAARTIEVSHASEWVVIEQDNDPKERRDCIWHTPPYLSMGEVRRLEAILTARNNGVFPDGFFRGFINTAEANALLSDLSSGSEPTKPTRPLLKEGDVIQAGGFKLTAKDCQTGILVWGRAL